MSEILSGALFFKPNDNDVGWIHGP